MSQNAKPRVEFIPVPMKGKSILCGIYVWMFIFPQWRLIEDWHYRLPDYTEIVIPQGFIFDGASVPRLLWIIFSPFDLLFIPGLIHDYAYQHNMLWGISDNGQRYEYHKDEDNRFFWDELFLQVAHQENDKRILNDLAWLGLFLGGWYVWNKYRRRP